MGLIRSNQWCN